MRNRRFLTSIAVLVAVLAFTIIAWGADSNVGTWKLAALNCKSYAIAT